MPLKRFQPSYFVFVPLPSSLSTVFSHRAGTPAWTLMLPSPCLHDEFPCRKLVNNFLFSACTTRRGYSSPLLALQPYGFIRSTG